MNWEAIGAISEAMGSIAVILTLAYLSLQVRQSKAQLTQNTELQKMSMRHEIYAVQHEIDAQRIDSAVMSKVFTKLYVDQSSLDAEELWNYIAYLRLSLSRLDSAYYQYKRGYFDDKEWQLEFDRQMEMFDLRLARSLWVKGSLAAEYSNIRSLVDHYISGFEKNAADV